MYSEHNGTSTCCRLSTRAKADALRHHRHEHFVFPQIRVVFPLTPDLIKADRPTDIHAIRPYENQDIKDHNKSTRRNQKRSRCLEMREMITREAVELPGGGNVGRLTNLRKTATVTMVRGGKCSERGKIQTLRETLSSLRPRTSKIHVSTIFQHPSIYMCAQGAP